MNYGKIQNGVLEKAPAIIQKGDKVVYQPSHKTYLENGYKPIVRAPYPEQEEPGEEEIFTAEYVDEGEQIVQIWTKTQPQPTIDADLCADLKDGV